MSKSPGHQQHPEHRVLERRLRQRMMVSVNGDVVADSKDVIQVDEDRSPRRFYFPRTDVKMEKLRPSPLTTQCPFKGTARYFSISAGGKQLEDSVWSYETPYDEHADLAGRVAFYDDKMPEIQVESA